MKVKGKANKKGESKPLRIWTADEFFKLVDEGVIKTSFVRVQKDSSLSSSDEQFLKSVTAGHHRNN